MSVSPTAYLLTFSQVLADLSQLTSRMKIRVKLNNMILYSDRELVAVVISLCKYKHFDIYLACKKSIEIEYKYSVLLYYNHMSQQPQLINIIREWVKTDNEMRTLKNEIATRKKTKDALSADLLRIMKESDIDGVDINDGRIEYTNRKTKKPITKKMLLNILSTYYKGNTSMANEVNNFILSNREEVTKEVIVRKVDKT